MASLNQRILDFLKKNGETSLEDIKKAMFDKYRSPQSYVSTAVRDLYENKKKIEKVFIGDVPLLGFKLIVDEVELQKTEAETPEGTAQDAQEQIDVTPEFALDRAIELIQEAFQAVKAPAVTIESKQEKVAILQHMKTFFEPINSEWVEAIGGMILDYERL